MATTAIAVLTRNVAEALYRLGNLSDREGKQKMALASFEAASKLGQQLVDQDPQNDKRRMELMIDLAHVGQIEKSLLYDRRTAWRGAKPGR